MLPAAELSELALRLQLMELGTTVVVVYMELAICSEENQIKNRKIPCIYTLNGRRTRAACLEGKHDNRFTISVTLKLGKLDIMSAASQRSRDPSHVACSLPLSGAICTKVGE